MIKTFLFFLLVATVICVTGIMLKSCSEVTQFDTRELSYPEQFMKYLLNERDSYHNKF
jgi:hypothetical protein